MNNKNSDLGFSTRAIHHGYNPQEHQGALIPPIYLTSTFTFATAEYGAGCFAGEEPGYFYTRIGNPTLALLEARMATLENGEAAVAFGSGMGAIAATLWTLLRPGDEVIVGQTLYGCTFALLHHGLGEFHLTREGGHSHRRIIHAADATGAAIFKTLLAQARQHPNIELLEQRVAVDLITEKRLGLEGDRCLGAYVLNRSTGQVDTFGARFVILASGGAAKVYLYTSNPDSACGDGIAMAWRSGCRVANLEFNDLCQQPTAVMDYLELSRQFDTWIIDELPPLAECSIAAQQRFVNLIDVLYDQDKRLLLIGQRPLAESLGGHAIDLARTRSRLGQLQEIGPEHPLERVAT